MSNDGRRADSFPVTSLSLLERAPGRDEEAWRGLVKLYHPLVLFWCACKGVQGADAEDVAQDVFRAAMTGLADFRRDRPGDSFRGWLRGVTHVLVRRHYARSGAGARAAGGSEALRHLEQVPAPAGAEEDPPEQISLLYRRALELVRGEFEDRTWQMFWRSVVEGQESATVAADLGVSTGGVRQARARVLRRLREEVSELLD